MPASSEYTLIKLMRGNVDSSEAWIPEVGEPLLDMESGTLRFGDAASLGGIPINGVTTVPMKAPANLNEAKIWGRYYINGTISNGPDGITSGKFIFVIQASALKGAEIIQTLQLLDQNQPAKTYNRITLNAGIDWTPWKEASGGMDSSNPAPSVDDYTTSGNYYIENVVNGPPGLTGCDAFLFVYRKNNLSPYIYQFMLLTKCTQNDGKIYVRHSRDGGETWESSIYTDWFELTDFCKRDFSNLAAGAVLSKEHGGTGRTDGTVWQADEAKRAYYSLNYSGPGGYVPPTSSTPPTCTITGISNNDQDVTFTVNTTPGSSGSPITKIDVNIGAVKDTYNGSSKQFTLTLSGKKNNDSISIVAVATAADGEIATTTAAYNMKITTVTPTPCTDITPPPTPTITVSISGITNDNDGYVEFTVTGSPSSDVTKVAGWISMDDASTVPVSASTYKFRRKYTGSLVHGTLITVYATAFYDGGTVDTQTNYNLNITTPSCSCDTYVAPPSCACYAHSLPSASNYYPRCVIAGPTFIITQSEKFSPFAFELYTIEDFTPLKSYISGIKINMWHNVPEKYGFTVSDVVYNKTDTTPAGFIPMSNFYWPSSIYDSAIANLYVPINFGTYTPQRNDGTAVYYNFEIKFNNGYILTDANATTTWEKNLLGYTILTGGNVADHRNRNISPVS